MHMTNPSERRCAACGGQLSSTAKFCNLCGARVVAEPPKPVVRFCTNCGSHLMEGARFCGHCGTPVPGAAPVMQQPVYSPVPTPPPEMVFAPAEKTIVEEVMTGFVTAETDSVNMTEFITEENAVMADIPAEAEVEPATEDEVMQVNIPAEAAVEITYEPVAEPVAAPVAEDVMTVFMPVEEVAPAAAEEDVMTVFMPVEETAAPVLTDEDVMTVYMPVEPVTDHVTEMTSLPTEEAEDSVTVFMPVEETSAPVAEVAEQESAELTAEQTEQPEPIVVMPPVEEPAPQVVMPPVEEPAPQVVMPPVEEPAPQVFIPPVAEPVPQIFTPPVAEAPRVFVAPVAQPTPVEKTFEAPVFRVPVQTPSAPVVAEQPAPVVVEQPVPVVAEQPAPVAPVEEERPAPAPAPEMPIRTPVVVATQPRTPTYYPHAGQPQNSLAHPEEIPSAPAAPAPEAPVSTPVPTGTQTPAAAQTAAPKKDSKLLVVLAIVAAVLAVLAVLFFVVHIWSEPVCGQSTKCLICGKTEGKPVTHDWQAVTCAAPRTCARCGQTQGDPLPHQWVEATRTEAAYCSVCGFRDGTPMKPDLWILNLVSGGDGDMGRSVSEVKDGKVLLSYPNLPEFAEAVVDVSDADGVTMADGCFLVEWVDGVAQISPGENLTPGVYNINFQLKDMGAMLTVCCGFEGETYRSPTELFWGDCTWRNWDNGLYLSVSGEKVLAVASAGRATAFFSQEEMFGMKLEAGDTTAQAVAEPLMDFITEVYVRDGKDEYVAFRYGDWYVTCNADGNVFLTKELTDACFWQMNG